MQRFGAIGMHRPEQAPRVYAVLSSDNTITAGGRDRITAPQDTGERVFLILSTLSPDKVQEFHQQNVRATHALLQRGSPRCKIGDELAKLGSDGGPSAVHYRVNLIHDKGGLGIDTVYICEERGDR